MLRVLARWLSIWRTGLQTPIFLMLDLEIGMNEQLSKPFTWDDSRRMDRGKVMTAADLDAGKKFGRYLDVDDDGITYRTYPGTHPSKGAFFTRGTSKDRMARYSERRCGLSGEYGSAAEEAPHRPQIHSAGDPDQGGAVNAAWCNLLRFHQRSSVTEADEILIQEQGVCLDQLRLRGFPFGAEVEAFVAEHDTMFVVEQNRDGQMRSLLINELEIDPKKLIQNFLHYDGTPITALFIAEAIGEKLEADKIIRAA